MYKNVKELTGCAWHTLAISSQDAPYSIAKTASLTISPTPYKINMLINNNKIIFRLKHTGPIKWHPNNLSVTLSPRTFMKPSVSLLVLALLLATNGNFPTL